jgi:hypothetical protein
MKTAQDPMVTITARITDFAQANDGLAAEASRLDKNVLGRKPARSINNANTATEAATSKAGLGTIRGNDRVEPANEDRLRGTPSAISNAPIQTGKYPDPI